MKSTYSVKVLGGIPLSIPNTVVDHDDYYVSYNNHDIGLYGSDTTALVKGQMEKFYILNGDHRKAYSALDGFDACMDYFRQNIKDIAKYSDK